MNNPVEIPGENVRNYYRGQGFRQGIEQGKREGYATATTEWVVAIRKLIDMYTEIDLPEHADTLQAWLNERLGIQTND